jgi:hypothetical protein
MQVFGRTFRRPEPPRAWWMVALTALGILIYLGYLTTLALNLGTFLWAAYRRLPGSNQQLAGRVGALGVGVVWFSTACVRWRHRLYLNPAMRDLVSTPATEWQVLRLATRNRFFSLGSIYGIAFVLFLFPWFSTEWLLILTEYSWSSVSVWQNIFGGLCAVVAAAMLMALLDSLALSINLLAGALGAGGVAPHYTFLNWIWAFIRRPVLYSVLGAVGLMIFSLMIKNLPFPAPVLSSAPLVHLGQSLLDGFGTPGTAPHTLLKYFPSVCWFDCITAAIHGPAMEFQRSLYCCLLWMSASVVMTTACLKQGLSIAARAGWRGVGEVRPADAIRQVKRKFDADAVNGPLERWLIARIGRMGRATLRLVSRNPQAGAVDIHLKWTLLLCIPAVLGGWLALYAVPDLLESFMNTFEKPISSADLHTAGELAAATVLSIFSVGKMHLWGMLSFMRLTPSNTSQSQDALSQIFQQQGLIRRQQVTRGDNRYPLIEIYAIGFKDAVLLPLFYAMGWLLLVILTAGAEALILHLPAEWVGWATLIGYLAMLQLYFLLSLGAVMMYTALDYRRSRLRTMVQSMFNLLQFGIVAGMLIALVGYLWSETFRQNRYGVAVLGTANILLICNVVLYSVCRWVYLRRRFDCEISSGRQMY